MDTTKIDFVMIWVDGNDPEWQKEKNIYDKSNDKGDSTIVRYRSWDNLQYWFRGVDTSPWGRQAAPGRTVTAGLEYTF